MRFTVDPYELYNAAEVCELASGGPGNLTLLELIEIRCEADCVTVTGQDGGLLIQESMPALCGDEGACLVRPGELQSALQWFSETRGTVAVELHDARLTITGDGQGVGIEAFRAVDYARHTPPWPRRYTPLSIRVDADRLMRALRAARLTNGPEVTLELDPHKPDAPIVISPATIAGTGEVVRAMVKPRRCVGVEEGVS